MRVHSLSWVILCECYQTSDQTSRIREYQHPEGDHTPPGLIGPSAGSWKRPGARCQLEDTVSMTSSWSDHTLRVYPSSGLQSWSPRKGEQDGAVSAAHVCASAGCADKGTDSSLCWSVWPVMCILCVFAYREYMLSLATGWTPEPGARAASPTSRSSPDSATPRTTVLLETPCWGTFLDFQRQTLSQEDFLSKPRYQLSKCPMQLGEKHLAASGFVSFLGEWSNTPFTWIIASLGMEWRWFASYP